MHVTHQNVTINNIKLNSFFSIMAASNLHIGNNYSSYAYVINFIVIMDHENIGTDTIFMTLPLILANIFPKLEFLVMNALICIYAN